MAGIPAGGPQEVVMEPNPAHAAVTRALELVTLGTPVEYRGLSMTPLLGDDAPAGEYLTLGEALDAGDVEITEISEDGRVPELRLKNRAVRPVLIVDGEELVGAKQNRVLNLSVLAGAQRHTIIPVSCVEAGRWRHATRQFSSSSRAHFASSRAAKVAEVSASLTSEGTRRSDQGAVWEAIAAKACPSARDLVAAVTSAESRTCAGVGEGIDVRLEECDTFAGLVHGRAVRRSP
jgi:hypothetical protein